MRAHGSCSSSLSPNVTGSIPTVSHLVWLTESQQSLISCDWRNPSSLSPHVTDIIPAVPHLVWLTVSQQTLTSCDWQCPQQVTALTVPQQARPDRSRRSTCMGRSRRGSQPAAGPTPAVSSCKTSCSSSSSSGRPPVPMVSAGGRRKPSPAGWTSSYFQPMLPVLRPLVWRQMPTDQSEACW